MIDFVLFNGFSFGFYIPCFYGGLKKFSVEDGVYIPLFESLWTDSPLFQPIEFDNNDTM